LLLGVIREGTGITHRIFTESLLPLDQIRKKLEDSAVAPRTIVAGDPQEIPFSAETKRVLHLAAEEADRLLHNRIDTEHLLLGILREERSVAATLLVEHGLRIGKVRDDIVLLLHQQTTIPRSPDGKPDVPPSYDVHISPTTREEEQGRSAALMITG
jgi:ATP-dependent Clp protease ATP-binding subunit ClpC